MKLVYQSRGMARTGVTLGLASSEREHMDLHIEDGDILIHPKRGRKEKALPGRGLLLVNPSEAHLVHGRWRDQGGEARSLFNSLLTVNASGQSFVAGPAIGAPMATITLEKLIALGAESIVLFGWCGAIVEDLRIGELLIPDMAVSGEGTSPHYPHVAPITPNAKAGSELRQWLLEKGYVSRTGTVWSTDAIFRENRHVLSELQRQQGVVAVDMEFSALCVVSAFRKITFSALLVVSDELSGREWRPGFRSPRFLEAKNGVLDLLLASDGLWR